MISLKLATLLVVIPACTFSLQNDVAKTDSAVQLTANDHEPNTFMIDVGFSPNLGGSAIGWGAPWAVRAGFAIPRPNRTKLVCYFDYYEYKVGGGDHTHPSPTSATRRDLAFYPAVIFHDVVVIGAGVYYTKSDPVNLIGMFSDSNPWSYANLSEIRFFFIVGAKFNIPVATGISLPVGLFYRQSYGDRSAPIFLRTGLELQL